MIVVNIIGGLGNQLFQYALGRRLGIETGLPLRLDAGDFATYTLRSYELEHFRIATPQATPEEVAVLRAHDRISAFQRVMQRAYVVKEKLLHGKAPSLPPPTPPIPPRAAWPASLREPPFPVRIVKEPASQAFDPGVLQVGGHAYLIGYWQSEKYFDSIADTLRDDLRLREEPQPVAVEWARRIAGVNAVSLHVRRGDYVTNPDVVAAHGGCAIGYYTQAARRILERHRDAHFFVFSDEPPWVRQNLPLDAPADIVSDGHALRSHEEMWLMSQCRHHIVANSSFSWWGAWLNPRPDKTVIAPARWWASQGRDDRDVVPASWLRIPNDGSAAAAKPDPRPHLDSPMES